MAIKKGAAPQVDLKTLIHDHALFFDRLIDLIPARFYVPVPDSKQRPSYRGLSKAEKASEKRVSRENVKKARRSRFDPEKTASTVDLLKEAIEEEKKSLDDSDDEKTRSGNDSESDREAEVENPRPVISGDRSVTYEELRERYHRRIEELRGNRNTRTFDRPNIEKKDRRKNVRMQHRDGGDAPHGKRMRDEEAGKDGDDMKKIKDRSANVEDISFGKVKLGDERGTKKRKLSKHQELEKAKKLEDAKKDPEKGKVIAKKHSWTAAMSRAVGEKVHDDPKVLQKSLKKEKKRHQKHAEKWKERIESQSKVRQEKQKNRSENIRERVQQKKARRIEKREKKLMRPGFEGRKDGYINE